MRDRIWNTLTDAKFTQIYAEIVCQNYKRISNIVNIITILFSSGGVIMGLRFWKDGTIFPLVSCIIITVIQAVKQVTPKLFPTDKEYKKYDAIIVFYHNHFLKLDELWHQFEANEIDESKARTNYYNILSKEKKILPIANEVLTDNRKRRKKKAEKETKKFFNNNY